MSEDPVDRPLMTPIDPPRGPTWSTIVAGLIVVIAVGALGRLVPSSEASVPAAETVAPTPRPAVLLVSPFAQVLYRRTTEVAVRGTAPVGTEEVAVAVVVDSAPIGEARIEVDARGRFNGLVPIVPPEGRSVAVLEVRDPRSPDSVLATVSFAVQASSLVLVRDPSTLRGTAGTTLVVDVLVYGSLNEVRGLLTTVDGRLITAGSMRVGTPPAGAPWPRTMGLTIEIPLERLPARARLHVLAVDRAGNEVEHIDVNVALSNT